MAPQTSTTSSIKPTVKARSRSFVGEFRNFISRGNVVDLAIGVIIGGAFGKIVTSLVEDVIMPPIGVLLGGVNFTDFKWQLAKATVDELGKPVPAVTINYGSFVQNMLNFFIIAITVFLMIKLLAAVKASVIKKEEEEAKKEAKKEAEELKVLKEIRDLLAKSK